MKPRKWNHENKNFVLKNFNFFYFFRVAGCENGMGDILCVWKIFCRVLILAVADFIFSFIFSLFSYILYLFLCYHNVLLQCLSQHLCAHWSSTMFFFCIVCPSLFEYIFCAMCVCVYCLKPKTKVCRKMKIKRSWKHFAVIANNKERTIMLKQKKKKTW